MNKVNISIDDVSPHPYASVGVINRCNNLIDIFPDIKFSLFIPLAYWQTIARPQFATNTIKPLKIDEYPDFCDFIRELPEENFEICYHGYFHGIPFRSNNDEFQYLTFNEAEEKFNLIFDTADRAGLYDKFKKIFRPPAWRMSPDAINVAEKTGIEILALSPDEYAVKTYGGEEKKFKNVVYYNVNPPFKELKLFDKTEMVYHACEWDKNYLSVELVNKLQEFLVLNKNKIDFCFLEELV